MNDAIRDMHEAALARAVEANLTAFHAGLSEWPEVRLHRDDDRIWTVSRRRFSLCNVVLEGRFDPAEVDAQIERALAPYLALNVNVMWKLGPSTLPANLGDRLPTHGFLLRPHAPGHGARPDLARTRPRCRAGTRHPGSDRLRDARLVAPDRGSWVRLAELCE